MFSRFFFGKRGYVGDFEECYWEAATKASSQMTERQIADSAHKQFMVNQRKFAKPRVYFEQAALHGPDVRYAAVIGNGHGVDGFGTYGVVLGRHYFEDGVFFRGNSARIVDQHWIKAVDLPDWDKVGFENRVGLKHALQDMLQYLLAVAMLSKRARDASAELHYLLSNELSMIEVHIHRDVLPSDIEEIRISSAYRPDLAEAIKILISNDIDCYRRSRAVTMDGGTDIMRDAAGVCRIVKHMSDNNLRILMDQEIGDLAAKVPEDVWSSML